ncbi:unnamed protein product [Clonostachys solani]|uniref:Uncharacterized protein n=1 Tax=Clonostachys solani TaxID=160281 RepID=A0A9N9Z8L7_9HYPO|nr:unnamed protein product [Clonostachys solani]
MLIRRLMSSLRLRRRRGSEASVSSVSSVEQEIEAGNINPAKLASTVKERFAEGEFTITVEIDACRYTGEG